MPQIWIMTQKQTIDTVETQTGIACEYKYRFKNFVEFFENHDIKKWQVGLEEGKKGLIHFQIRFEWGTKDDFTEIKKEFPTAHLEWGEKWSNYETKEGHYITSFDNIEKLKIRFGTPTEKQISVIENVMKQNDRQITCWLDVKGGHGKTWLCHYLYETRKGFYCPPNLNSQRMIEHIADGYEGQPIIVIDIPRACKWSDDLYIALETIKDGLIVDSRYNSRIKSIRGVKVLVMANSVPNLKKLTADRWLNESGELVKARDRGDEP